MARLKRSELDQLLDDFCQKSAEDRAAILYGLHGAHRALNRMEREKALKPKANGGESQVMFEELGERVAEGRGEAGE